MHTRHNLQLPLILLTGLSFALLALAPTSTLAQPSPVSEVKDSGGSTLMTIFDNGQLETSNGFLLPDGTLLDDGGDLGALSLPFSGSASTGPVFEIENTGAGDGIAVTSAGDDGVYTTGANFGFYSDGAGSHGLLIGSSGDDGIDVNDSGRHGVFVRNSTTDGINIIDSGSDGIDVSGSTDMAGRFVGSHDDGPIVGVENNGTDDGVVVTGAGDDGFKAENVSYGLYVPGADVAGLLVSGNKDGIVAEGDLDGDGSGLAGDFIGDVDVSQTLSAATKNFKIDHPQDPTSKYLQHTTVESPKMLNVYSGNVTLNASGEATVQLPDYFEAANTNYRYQLTAIGAPGPNLHIAAEISNNQFRIAGGDSNMKVSWRVTGVRNDPYAQQNRVQAEVQKPASKQGTYRHPEAYGAPESQGEAAIEKKQDREEVRSLKQKEKTPAEKDKQEKKKEQGQ